MKLLFSLAAAAALLTMSGCALYTPGAAVVVDPHHAPVKAAPAGGGRFCPPGQAKKGNC